MHLLYNVRRSRFTRALLLLCVALFALCPPVAHASQLNDKLLNRPYTDLRRWHLGFSVGLNALDLSLHNNGFITADGNSWFMEQPSFSPGFCVNALVDLRLNSFFNLRFTPGLWFGSRNVHFRDVNASDPQADVQTQDIKSAYLVFPLELKYSALRLRNIRPYLITGIIPALDVAKKKPEFLKLKSSDFMLSVGFGCDIYLPYFKLIPELKFCFGLTDVIDHKRHDLVDDPLHLGVSNSVKRATSKMFVLSFYFE